MTDFNRNATRVNGGPPPYTVPPSTMPVSIHEELPPSYESVVSSLPPHEERKLNRY